MTGSLFFPWLGVLLYVLFLVVIAGVLYLTIRLAVLHALRAHTRWLETRLRE